MTRIIDKIFSGKKGFGTRKGFIGDERIKELLAEGDTGVAKSAILSSLEGDPWNEEGLRKLAKVSNGRERQLILEDLFRTSESDLSVFKELLSTETSLFERGETGSIDLFVNRIFRLLKMAEGNNEEMIRIQLEEISRASRKRKRLGRDVALVLFRANGLNSDRLALKIFDCLEKRNKDARIIKSALNSSIREKRYFLSLRLTEIIDDPDVRELEKWKLIRKILDLLFLGRVGEVETMLSDLDGGEWGEKIREAIGRLAPYSDVISEYEGLETGTEGIDVLEVHLKSLRESLRSEYKRGGMLSDSIVKFGKLSDDLLSLPLYQILKRIEAEIEAGAPIENVFATINKIIQKIGNEKPRALEILVVSLDLARVLDHDLAMKMVYDMELKKHKDERVLRVSSKIVEDDGRLEEAITMMQGLKQPSSKKALERMQKTRKWIVDGYRIPIEREADDYTPIVNKVMYNVHASLPYTTSGYTIRTREVASALKELGLDIVVNTRWGFPLDRGDFEHDGSEINREHVDLGVRYTLSPDVGGIRENKFEDYSIIASKSILERAIVERPAAIISASDASIGLASCMAARSLGVPFIYEMRGIWAYSKSADEPYFENSTRFKLLLRLEKQCAMEADAVFVISRQMKKIVKSWGVENRKILVVPNGINDGEEWPEDTPSGAMKGAESLRVGYIGSLKKYEGVELLIEAIDEANKEIDGAIDCVIIGDGPARSELEDLCDNLGLREHVQFSGRISHDEIVDCYNSVDLIVVPRKSNSVCEIVPALKPLEAMKFGKLVVCSDVGPSKELIEMGENGLLFEKDDHLDLARILSSVHNDRDLLNIGVSARQWVVKNRLWKDNFLDASRRIFSIILKRILESQKPRVSDAEELIGSMYPNGGFTSKNQFHREFEELVEGLSDQRKKRTCFLAHLRHVGRISPEEGLAFGLPNLKEFGDRRSIRSMFTYARKVGNLDLQSSLFSDNKEILEREFTGVQSDLSGEIRCAESSEKIGLERSPKWYSFELADYDSHSILELSGEVFIPKHTNAKSSLARFEFYDDDEELILEKPNDLFDSKDVGFFEYLWPEENIFSIVFKPPEGTVRIQVGIQTWGEGTEIEINPKVSMSVAGRGKLVPKSARDIYQSNNWTGFSVGERNDVLIYSDSTLNLIDGSSIWIQSVALCLAEEGRRVTVLCKDNISNTLIAGEMIKNTNIDLIEPKEFGIDNPLNPEEAATIIEIIDATHGGFSSIICRGMDLALEVRNVASLWKRVYFYLSDYYEVSDSFKRVVKDKFSQNISDLNSFCAGFLCQTEYIADEFGKKFEVPGEKMSILPPIIINKAKRSEGRERKREREKVRIGYAGKFAPLWGIRELISTCEELIERGIAVELDLVGGKFNRGSGENRDFVTEIKEKISENEWINWHGPKSRIEASDIIRQTDIAWCYRPPELEENTLEISTKLLEYYSNCVPFVAFSNVVNKDLLGDNSKFLVNSQEECADRILELIEYTDKGENIFEESLIDSFSGQETGKVLGRLLPVRKHGKDIVLNGHDLKFIFELESYLKTKGHMVIRDNWEWGGPDQIWRSERLVRDAEIIISEWGLANAAWYSKEKGDKQRHIVRIHSQEIRERARKLASNIEIEGCDEMIFVAEHIRDAALELFPWDLEKTCVIPNFVDCQRFHLEKEPDVERNIAMVGIVPQSKRVDLAIEVIRGLVNESNEWKLILKGKTHLDLQFMRGPSRTEEFDWFEKVFEEVSSDSELSTSIQFEGHSSPISNWYPRASYVLSLSEWESFHYSIAEGAVSGSFPLILDWEGSRGTYKSEWIFSSIDGIIKEILRIEKLEEGEKMAIRRKNREFIEGIFDIDKIFGEWERKLE